MIDKFLHVSFISQLEANKIDEALTYSILIDVMQDEFNQFEINKVWHLVLKLSNKHIIRTR